MKQSTTLIPTSVALLLLFAAGLSSCSPQRAAEAEAAAKARSSAAPVSELDGAINAYEKTANEFVRVAKKIKGGDVSLTIRYMDLTKSTREAAAKLQQEAGKMSPAQAQRVAAITARAAPYLSK